MADIYDPWSRGSLSDAPPGENELIRRTTRTPTPEEQKYLDAEKIRRSVEGGAIAVGRDSSGRTTVRPTKNFTKWDALALASVIAAPILASWVAGSAVATTLTMPASTTGLSGPIAGLPLYDAAGKIIAGSAAAGTGAAAAANTLAGATTGPTLAQELAGRGGTGLTDIIKKTATSVPWWETAAKIGVPVGAAALMGGKGSDTSTQPFDEATLAQIQELLSMAIGRQKRTEPLHQAAMAMATRLAPTYARNAMGLTPTPSTPASGSDDTQNTIDQFLNSLGR